MPKKVGLVMRVPESTSAADFDASGGLGAVAGVTSKLARAGSPKMVELLQDLLGKPLINPRNPTHLFQISSVDPAAGIVRLHTNAGGRILSTIEDFVRAFTSGALEEAGNVTPAQLGGFERFKDWTAGGERIPRITEIGPKGGTTTRVTRRPIPPTATR